jgi:hypothetical protein
VRRGLRFLRTALPDILATHSNVLSPRMVRVIEELAGDWHRLEERIEGWSSDIDIACSEANQRLHRNAGKARRRLARLGWAREPALTEVEVRTHRG